jgi:hypothetical protein
MCLSFVDLNRSVPHQIGPGVAEDGEGALAVQFRLSPTKPDAEGECLV